MMTPAFAFPADALKPARVDEAFADQADALRAAGFSVWAVRLDERKLVTRGDDATGAAVVYRGWMLSLDEYESYVATVTQKGAAPFTATEAYRSAHHIPGWYDALEGLTPETVFLPTDCDLEVELRRLGWDRFFIKDYVKSLKTGTGSLITNPSQVHEVAAQMRHFRGTIEGGFSIRRVEDLLPETETRYFVLRGQTFSPVSGVEVPSVVSEVAALLASRSPFFSVDVARRNDGQLRVVEVGDGQVSDLVGWSVERFVSMWGEAAIQELRL